MHRDESMYMDQYKVPLALMSLCSVEPQIPDCCFEVPMGSPLPVQTQEDCFEILLGSPLPLDVQGNHRQDPAKPMQ